MEIVNRVPSELIPAEYNPRKISEKDFKQLKKSLSSFQCVEPIIVNQYEGRENVIVGGHQRLKAMIDLGWSDVPTIEVHLDLAEEKELNVRLNKNTGEFDFELLTDLFSIDELEDIGFDPDELPNIIEDMTEPLTDPDDVPEIPEIPKTILGDIYELGNHRLMCGDSTSIDAVEELIDNNKVEITFTSPPYNAGKTPTEAKTGKKSKYNNYEDNLSDSEYTDFLSDYINISLIVSDYSFCNIQSISGNKTSLIDLLYNLKEVYADTIIWDKLMSQPAMAENVLNSEYEYIHIFSKKANRSIGCKKFRGTISNILHLSKQTKNKIKEHNATFSIDFASFFVSNFSNEASGVYDPFGGSGTTMIACEQLARKSFLMELDPKYCDVIVRRWEEFTGKKAKLLTKEGV
tara:strand:+ start:1307 stop:2518 length:1212 start_codon:yes stop_codon:yes gene_type:complete